MIPPWGVLKLSEKPLWEVVCEGSEALAVGKNAVAVAFGKSLRVVDIATGKVLWEQALPSKPVPWGMAVDRFGDLILCLQNGTILCYGKL